MRWKDIVPAALVAVALCGMALFPRQASAEKPDAKKIDKLIEQLGSDTFDERESATKALDAIGGDALVALEKAAKSSDAEIRKRAAALAARIGSRVTSGAVLKPTEVHLVFKDTPIKEAIAAFEKKAGVSFNLIDPENKLKGKKITLDTGKVTFWAAMEKFCAAAGLEEADPNKIAARGFPGKEIPPGFDVPPPPPLPGGIGGRLPGIGVRPGVGVKKLTDAEIKALKEKIEALKKEAEEAAKKAKDEAERLKKEELKKRGADGVGAAAGVPAVAVAVAVDAADAPVAKPLPGVAIQPLPPVVVFPGGPPMAGGMPFPGPGGMPLFQHGKINLTPGAAKKTPADTSSSVRVRVAPEGTAMPWGRPDAKTLALILQATPEPRLRWQELKGITIEKAIDDNGQKLTKQEAAAGDGPMGGGGVIGGPGGVIIFPGGGFGKPGFPGMGGPMSWSNDGVNQNLLLQLKKGEKASKKLKELSGSIQARFLGEAKPHIVADNLMKAAGKTFKGKLDGSITVKSVDKNADGTVTIRFEFEQPTDIVPETQLPAGVNPVGVEPVGPPIRIRPGIRPRPGIKPMPVPVPPDAVDPAAKPVEKPAVEKPAVEKPVADKPAARKKGEIKGEIKVEIVVGGAVAGGPAIALPPMVGGGGGVAMPGIAFPAFPAGYAYMGLTLQDDKGNVLGQVQPDWMKGGFGGGPGMKMEYVAVYKARKGQPAVPAKLVFTGRSAIDITVPFKLENIDLK